MVNFDIQQMKDRVMFGIPLFDSEGNPFPDDLLQSYLDSAIAWAEQKLNIAIQPRTITAEEHDYFLSDFTNWGYVKLWKKPILSVSAVEMWYGNQQMFTIPADWLKIDNLSGQITMFPTSGSAGGMIITATGGLVTPLLTGNISYAPKLWRITYDAGMNDDADGSQGYQQNDMLPQLREVIYKKAAIGIMGVWGDLIIGAGIANQSVSMDGFSQSIGTTQSPMFGGASARIKQLEEDINSYMPSLRAYYNGIDMTVM